MSKTKRPTRSHQKPKIYQLGLYGASGSGKTLLLASLAMDRINYHPNYTCTRVPIGQALGDQDDSNPKRSDPVAPSKRVERLQHGKENLDKAIDALTDGRMPEPTPSNHPDMLFEYDFCTGERTYRIELMDYAGEFVHSTLSANEKAVRLRKELKTRDALLVLAPAPWPEDDHKALDTDLRSLQETFRLLCGEREETDLQIPVAMIFTKWDRRSPLEYRSPESESREMEEFLNQDPPPPHKSLLNTLRSSVADPENFKAFPVSALGECRKIDLGHGQWAERPETFNPLRSFGLEDPFIWAVERRDAMDIASYEANLADLNLTQFSRWLPWPPTLRNLFALERTGRKLTHRFPSVDPQRVSAEQMWKQVKSARDYLTMTSALAILLVVLFGEFTWDGIRFQQIQHTISDPQANFQDVEAAESWLLRYTESPPFRHRLAKWWLLDKASAESSIERLRNGREDLYWAEIKNEADLNKKAQLSQAYLAEFTNGNYRKEAVENIAENSKTQSWNEFIRSYSDVLNEGKTVEAAALLKGRGADPGIEALKQSFEPAAMRYLETEINRHLIEGKVDDAYAIHRQIQQWPLDLNVRTEGGRIKEAELMRAIRVVHDRTIYDQVRDYMSSSTISTYLEQAPLGTMREAVASYQAWQNTQTSELPLKLTVTSIGWGRETDSENDVELRVSLNDKPIFTIPKLVSKRNTTSRLNQESYALNAKLDDSVNLNVALKDYGLFSDDDWGNAVRTVQVKELNGLRMNIRTDKLNNVVTFGLSGIPNQPDLPPWREE